MSVDSGHATDEAFVRLLAEYRKPLFRFVFCLVHSMHDAEDLFQQVTFTLWDRFNEFEPGTDFYAWACTVAKNKALNFFKASKRKKVYFSPQLIDEIAKREQVQSEFYEARLKALAACRQKLAAADQELLAACYDSGRSIGTAAAEIGRPVGSVYTSLSRIRSALHACIKRALAAEVTR
jgi:RNA polymerase sigma-70 factor (ECF subfamily)